MRAKEAGFAALPLLTLTNTKMDTKSGSIASYPGCRASRRKMTPAQNAKATRAAMKEWKTPGPLSKIRLSICAPAEQFCGNLVFFLRHVMGESFRRTSLPPSGCSRLFPELSWWFCNPSFRRLTAIFVWHTFSRSDLLWRWGRRAATSLTWIPMTLRGTRRASSPFVRARGKTST